MLSQATEGPLGRSYSLAARIGVAVAMLLCATGCLHRRRVSVPSVGGIPPRGAPAAPVIQGEAGIASWYGYPYNGRRAASGEIYNMYAMTAAHRTLPFNTEVRVHDLDNGRTVDVRINDRGPFVEGRIIDLSYAAAQAMGMPGLAHVKLEILGLGSTTVPGVFAVQVGAFRDPANADRLRNQIASSFGPVEIVSFDRGDGLFYRVRVGHENSMSAAQELAARLRSANLATATFVVRVN